MLTGSWGLAERDHSASDATARSIRRRRAVWGQLPITGLQNSGPSGQSTLAFDSKMPNNSGSVAGRCGWQRPQNVRRVSLTEAYFQRLRGFGPATSIHPSGADRLVRTRRCKSAHGITAPGEWSRRAPAERQSTPSLCEPFVFESSIGPICRRPRRTWSGWVSSRRNVPAVCWMVSEQILRSTVRYCLLNFPLDGLARF